MDFYEIIRDGVVYEHGPESVFPNARARKMFRADGYKVYVHGELYKD